MANVGPLAQGGLDEAFRLAVGARSVRTGEAVPDAELEAGGAEVSGAIAGAIVGEQATDGDAVLGVEGDGGAQEGDSGLALLVGQHAGEGETGVIVDGDVQSLPAGELRASAPTTVATNGDLLITGHTLDVEMKQIAGSGMLVAHDRRIVETALYFLPGLCMCSIEQPSEGNPGPHDDEQSCIPVLPQRARQGWDRVGSVLCVKTLPPRGLSFLGQKVSTI